MNTETNTRRLAAKLIETTEKLGGTINYVLPCSPTIISLC